MGSFKVSEEFEQSVATAWQSEQGVTKSTSLVLASDVNPDVPSKTELVKKFPSYANSLIDILLYKRASSSHEEEAFIERFIDSIPNMQNDHYGNRWIVINRPDGKFEPTMFSCHTDTMHREDFERRKKNSKRSAKQEIRYADGFLMLDHDRNKAQKSWSNCLGADNGAGVWLLLQMIEAKIPGTYVFHRDEEVGRCGSIFMARKYEDWAKTFKFAIAFDRKGTKEIITHQMSERTCSDDFARSLAAQISHRTADYAPSDKGAYTDTKSYSNLIAECTNVGVGYYGEHGPLEKLDLGHVLRLRNKLVRLDTSQLVVERDPKEKPYQIGYYYGGRYSGRKYGGGWCDYDDEPYGYWKDGAWHESSFANNDDDKKKDTSETIESTLIGEEDEMEMIGDLAEEVDNIDDFDEKKSNKYASDMSEIIRDFPEAVAEFLLSEGITLSDLEHGVLKFI